MLKDLSYKFDGIIEEAKEDLKETLKWFGGYYSDLHNEVFNTDYYIIGYYQAEKKLEELGVFDCIRLVKEYEESNFGEAYTDFSNSEKLINMVYYIIGDMVINEVISDYMIDTDIYGIVATEEHNRNIIELLN